MIGYCKSHGELSYLKHAWGKWYRSSASVDERQCKRCGRRQSKCT